MHEAPSLDRGQIRAPASWIAEHITAEEDLAYLRTVVTGTSLRSDVVWIRNEPRAAALLLGKEGA
jgi:hypothetical protein